MFNNNSSIETLRADLAVSFAADLKALDKARLELASFTRAHAHLNAGGKLANNSRIRDARERVRTLETLINDTRADGGIYSDDGRFIKLVE